MAGRGPNPEHPDVRARRNRTTTRGTLRAIDGDEAKGRKVPSLPRIAVNGAGGAPARDEDDKIVWVRWHARVQAWWRDLWQRSDVTEQLLEHEKSGALLDLALLRNDFWFGRGEHREVRLMETELGLMPMARRRLQQEIARGDAAADRTLQRRNERSLRAAAEGGDDPRDALAQ